MPRPNCSVRSMIRSNWRSGVMVFQSLAQKSAPNTTMPRRCSRSSRTGVEAKPEWKLDGVNLLPFLTGADPGSPHDALFWRMGSQAGVRKGDWKLDRYDSTLDKPGARSNAARVEATPFRLYNLVQDPGEARDLSAGNPDKVKELLAAFESWDAQLVAPLWGPGGGPKGD